MRNTVALLLTILFLQTCLSQEVQNNSPNIAVKWAPTGLALGSLTFQGEYNMGGKSSLTANIGIPVRARHSFDYEGDDTEFEMKATSFLAGYRMYFSKKRHLRGLYLEPYFKYVHHSSEGEAKSTLGGRAVRMSFTNDYSGAGVGAQLGAQFMIKKRFVIDLFFLGPEINSATNNFRAVEASATIPWTFIEASEAERDIREFIDQFPFIRRKTRIMVDKDNKSVSADFKGALPGLRVGVSFGFAF